MSTQKNFVRVILLVLAFLGASFFPPFASDEAQAQDDCKTKLNQAQTAYTNGRLDEAIELLSDCVNKGKLSTDDEQRALKLLGFAYLAKDYVDQAKTTIQKLLELVPAYEPDPAQDPPAFTNMVKEMKKEKAAPGPEKPPAETTTPPVRKKKSKTWLFVGGGAVVAGGVAALVLGGGGGGGVVPPPTTSLPTPPPLP